MYTLYVSASFDAAHRLPEYNGPCRRIHGHRWTIRTAYVFSTLTGQGITHDLTKLKAALNSIVADFDHRHLNDMMTSVPTAENIARTIFERLQNHANPVHREYLRSVAVEETPDTCVVYEPPKSTRYAQPATMVTDEEPAEHPEEQTVNPDPVPFQKGAS